MNITITIENPTEQAIRALAEAVASHGEQAAAVAVAEIKPVVVSQPKPQAEAEAPAPVEKPKRQRAAKPEPQAEPEPQEPVAAPDATPEPEAQPETPQQHIPDVVEIRAKAQEIGKTADGKKAIKALLDKFGCTSLSAIPENQRADFMAELEQLV